MCDAHVEIKIHCEVIANNYNLYNLKRERFMQKGGNLLSKRMKRGLLWIALRAWYIKGNMVHF